MAAGADLDASPSPGCDEVIVIVTDGRLDDIPASITAANTQKQAGRTVVLIVVGGTPPFANLLDDIATPGFYFEGVTAEMMETILFQLPYTACGGTVQPPCLPPEKPDGPMPEHGDAPDSSNHFSATMTAYAGVQAAFPTVYDPATGADLGPRHNDITRVYLGERVSGEMDADLPPDEDFIRNINPSSDNPDQDWQDDGVLFPISLSSCGDSVIPYTVTTSSGITSTWLANVWIDFNRDGDWGDTLTCEDGEGVIRTVREWAVQDQALVLGSGTHSVTSTVPVSTIPTGSERSMWMRIGIAEQGAVPPWDGRGPTGGYDFGETEDYWINETTPGSGEFSPYVE